MRLIFLFFFIFSSVLFTNEEKLSESEIKSARQIEFQNKTTKRALSETKSLHESIGRKLGELMVSSPEKTHSISGVRVKRVLSNSKDKLGGDIIYLDKDTKFGHIHSIHRILSAYIQFTFKYNEKQADTLALYALYYNALNRNNINYILSKYTSEIKNYISPQKIGISTNYKDWPARTEIILPIEKNILKKFEKDVTLDELEEQVTKVIDEKKTGKEDRQKFEELKKEKIEKEKEILNLKKEELSKLDDLLEDKYKKIEERLSKLKEDPQAKTEEIAKLEKEKLETEKSKEDIKVKLESVEERKERLTEIEKKKNEKKSDEVSKETLESKDTTPKKEDEKNIVTKDEANQENVAFVPSKDSPVSEKPTSKEDKQSTSKEDVKKLEKELTEVKKELEKKKEEEKKKVDFSPNVLDGKIFFIKPVTYIEGQCNNELHALDPVKDDFVYKSEYNQICGKVFKEFGGNILVIGFKEHKEQIRLVLLSRVDLKPIGVSDVDVYQKTVLEINDNFLYAVEVENGKHYLAKFDKNLKRLNRTDQEIIPDGTITFYGKKIYISGKNESGKVEFKIFNRDDLKFIKKAQA